MATQKPLISLSQETFSQEILKKPKQGKYGTELIEEMKKPPIPIYPLPHHMHQQPPVKHSCPFPDHLLREKIRWKIWNQTRVDSDLCDWKGRQVVFPQPDGSFMVIGRRTQPGFSD